MSAPAPRRFVGDLSATPAVGRTPALPVLDKDTLRQLDLLATHGQGGARPEDVTLARQIAKVLATPSHAYPVALRLSLVGQMFSEILTDPHLPQRLHPQFERLRLPMIRIAVTDNCFFTDAEHSARMLMNRATGIGTLALIATAGGQLQAEETINGIGNQIALSALLMRPNLLRLATIPDTAISSFLNSQRDNAALRREAVELRTRRIAAQELEAQLLGRRLPREILAFLRDGWITMMASQLRHSGVQAASWGQGTDLLARLLMHFDPRSAAAQRERPEQLLAEAASRFREAGLRSAKVTQMTAQLKLALSSPDARKITPTSAVTTEAEAIAAGYRVLRANEDDEPASGHDHFGMPTPEQQLIQLILTPEHWFRVFDAQDGRTLWLKVDRHYPQQDRVTFTGFDAERSLTLRASRVTEDLLCGRSEPINPTENMRRALSALHSNRSAQSAA